MYREQVQWAVEEGADFVISETNDYVGEALIGLEVIQESGLPSVINFASSGEQTIDGYSFVDACKRLADAGADVVGLNCIRGPATLLPLIKRVREAVDVHVAALPVPYRTTEEEPSFQSLTDPFCDCLPGDGRPFPTALDPFYCNRYEIAEFAREAYDLGVRYLGVCCGAAPHFIRSMAEALGRETPASRYSPDMSRHAFLGTDPQLRSHNQAYAKEL
jgi:betaine-homocysteine S-methyltransferase